MKPENPPAKPPENPPEKPSEKPSEIPPGETVIVDTRQVACDGGGGALGHPKVFLEIGDGGEVVCPYCSRRYGLAGGDDATAP